MSPTPPKKEMPYNSAERQQNALEANSPVDAKLKEALAPGKIMSVDNEDLRPYLMGEPLSKDFWLLKLVPGGNSVSNEMATKIYGKGYGILDANQRYLISAVAKAISDASGLNLDVLPYATTVKLDFRSGSFNVAEIDTLKPIASGQLKLAAAPKFTEKTSDALKDLREGLLGNTETLYTTLASYGQVKLMQPKNLAVFISEHPNFQEVHDRLADQYAPAGQAEKFHADTKLLEQGERLGTAESNKILALTLLELFNEGTRVAAAPAAAPQIRVTEKPTPQIRVTEKPTSVKITGVGEAAPEPSPAPEAPKAPETPKMAAPASVETKEVEPMTLDKSWEEFKELVQFYFLNDALLSGGLYEVSDLPALDSYNRRLEISDNKGRTIGRLKLEVAKGHEGLKDYFGDRNPEGSALFSSQMAPGVTIKAVRLGMEPFKGREERARDEFIKAGDALDFIFNKNRVAADMAIPAPVETSPAAPEDYVIKGIRAPEGWEATEPAVEAQSPWGTPEPTPVLNMATLDNPASRVQRVDVDQFEQAQNDPWKTGVVEEEPAVVESPWGDTTPPKPTEATMDAVAPGVERVTFSLEDQWASIKDTFSGLSGMNVFEQSTVLKRNKAFVLKDVSGNEVARVRLVVDSSVPEDFESYFANPSDQNSPLRDGVHMEVTKAPKIEGRYMDGSMSRQKRERQVFNDMSAAYKFVTAS